MCVNVVYVCLSVCVSVYVCVSVWCIQCSEVHVEVRGQFVEVCSVLPPCAFQESNSDDQSQCPTALATEPSRQSQYPRLVSDSLYNQC